MVLRPVNGATVSSVRRDAHDYYDHSELTTPAHRPGRSSQVPGKRVVSSLVAASVLRPVRADFQARSRLCGPEDRDCLMCGSSSPTMTLWFDPSHRPRAGPQSSTSCIRCSRCVRRLVMSRLRQSPASPSGPVQHACFLRVSVPLTGRAVLWRLTIRRVLDHDERQSEDVNTHLSRSHRSDSTYAPEQAPSDVGKQGRWWSRDGAHLPTSR